MFKETGANMRSQGSDGNKNFLHGKSGRWGWFSPMWILACLLGCVLVGCAGKKSKKDPDKDASTLRLHMETQPGILGSGKVKVIRSQPITIAIEKEPFLDEGFVKAARVMETPGGHAIGVEFTERGALRLQMATGTRAGRRMVIWSRWTEGRWLAAVIVSRANDTGVIVFTPDASREECERIVRGLNNVAMKIGNQPKPPKPSKKKAKEEAELKKRDSFDKAPQDGIWEP